MSIAEWRRKCHRKPQGHCGLTALVHQVRCNARDRGIHNELTREQIRELSSKPCHYCGAPPAMVKTGPPHYDEVAQAHASYTYNGIDRVDNDQGYVLANCVPCCAICNYAKRKMTVEQFVAWARRLVAHQDRRAA